MTVQTNIWNIVDLITKSRINFRSCEITVSSMPIHTPVSYGLRQFRIRLQIVIGISRMMNDGRIWIRCLRFRPYWTNFRNGDGEIEMLHSQYWFLKEQTSHIHFSCFDSTENSREVSIILEKSIIDQPTYSSPPAFYPSQCTACHFCRLQAREEYCPNEPARRLSINLQVIIII